MRRPGFLWVLHTAFGTLHSGTVLIMKGGASKQDTCQWPRRGRPPQSGIVSFDTTCRGGGACGEETDGQARCTAWFSRILRDREWRIEQVSDWRAAMLMNPQSADRMNCRKFSSHHRGRLPLAGKDGVYLRIIERWRDAIYRDMWSTCCHAMPCRCLPC